MLIIISLFIVAAIMGLIMLVQIFSNKKPDKIVAYSHGLFAATSIALLFFQVLQGGNDKLVNLLMFVFVALIGIYMVYREFYSAQAKKSDSTKSEVPKSVVIVHALSAVIAFALLVVGYLS
ncbi:MAG: hypothetical protein ABJG78_18460 [Cyclobacteriaceae bacterium]